jgi:outer membrane protein assembly factor BamB
MSVFGRWAIRRLGVFAAIGAVVIGQSACISDKPKPTALEIFTPAPTSASRVLWSHKLDRVQFPLTLTAVQGRVGVASSAGDVLVLQADRGAVVWQATVGDAITAGVGFDGTRAAVVTRGNELVVLEAGAVKWRVALNTIVSSPPLVAGERVFVVGADRNVHAYDALNGQYIWALQRPGEALGLVSAGVATAYKNTLLVGQGPRLAALDPLRGTVQYEVPLASPRGTNEIERLTDLVGPVARVGDVVCVRAFQAAVGCVQADRGAVIWSKSVTGSQAVAADAQMLVAADGRDRVQAWKSTNGDTLWSHERVLHRGLGGAALLPKAVVFGDAQGFLHFFDRATGNTLQRLATDGSAVIGAPTVAQRVLLVVNRSGLVQGLAVD